MLLSHRVTPIIKNLKSLNNLKNNKKKKMNCLQAIIKRLRKIGKDKLEEEVTFKKVDLDILHHLWLMEDDKRWKEEWERWMRGPQTYKVWSRETEALWAVRDKEEKKKLEEWNTRLSEIVYIDLD